MYGYVYEVTCKVNGKKYIGQHKGNFDPKYLGSGTIQQRAIKKFGKSNFEVKLLVECDTMESLNAAEQYYININNAIESDEFYNLINYGQYCQFSAETRRKMSQAAKLRSNTPEFKSYMSKLHSGKKIPDEVIRKRTITLQRNIALNGSPKKVKNFLQKPYIK